MNNFIQVFEHQILKVYKEPFDENGNRIGIKDSEFKALLGYHSKVSDQYFTPSLNKLKFNHYVGVIQVGKLIIEILPKAGKVGNKEMWSNALYKMIRVAKDFRSKRGSQTKLLFKNERILELYLMEYLKELEEVLHRGLRKKYRFRDSNRRSVKGKILFSKDAVINHSDKSNVYCHYQSFDFNHEINRVLLHALNLVISVTNSREIISKAKALKIEFPENLNDKISVGALSKLNTNRNTDYYEKSLVLAKMIINNHSPSLKTDNNSVISFLFDMNHLFEEFVFKTLKKKLDGYKVYRKRISYWNGKRLIPDILVKSLDTGEVFVMDTKWKLPKNYKPDDADLRQVFTYNEYFGAKKGALLYPFTEGFVESSGKFEDREHECLVVGLNLFDKKNKLKQELLSKKIISLLVKRKRFE
ncbi:MAG: hypothetical protein CME70_11940 [Halobacteriovorax sp.]|nr:hypothetical protein [Halobacteriovorax sp.]|tara:strand:- start:324271 stop:325515 length:1245 start_codon:yes stop_codon:yes gene_type:complete